MNRKDRKEREGKTMSLPQKNARFSYDEEAGERLAAFKPLANSLSLFSEDFMNERIQPPYKSVSLKLI
jgi:hypothetical protein